MVKHLFKNIKVRFLYFSVETTILVMSILCEISVMVACDPSKVLVPVRIWYLAPINNYLSKLDKK